MSTPNIYILTKYLSYFITYQTAPQTGSFNQCQAHLTLCGIYMEWYYAEIENLGDFKTCFDLYGEDDNNHSYHFELMLTHTAIVA